MMGCLSSVALELCIPLGLAPWLLLCLAGWPEVDPTCADGFKLVSGACSLENRSFLFLPFLF